MPIAGDGGATIGFIQLYVVVIVRLAGIYGAAVTRRLRAMGIRDKPIAPGSPWQNGYAERLIGTIRRECLDHMIVFGEVHLRRILGKYAAYYNGSRIHRSLNKDARSIGRLSASALSHHCLSSAVFITNIAESDFWHTQLDQLMHTARSSSRVRLARRHDPLIPTQLPQFIFEQGQRSGGADRVPAHRYTAATNSANFLRA
jgi:hypothetical protein